MWLYSSATLFTNTGGGLYLLHGLQFGKLFLELMHTLFKSPRLLDSFSNRFNTSEHKISEPKYWVMNKQMYRLKKKRGQNSA